MAPMITERRAPGRYRISLHRGRGCWFASVMDLPGCIARGATQVEAIENSRAAIRAYQLAVNVLASDPATVVVEIAA
jgi:predicted RNase H-like HicB family nuclease